MFYPKISDHAPPMNTLRHSLIVIEYK